MSGRSVAVTVEPGRGLTVEDADALAEIDALAAYAACRRPSLSRLVADHVDAVIDTLPAERQIIEADAVRAEATGARETALALASGRDDDWQRSRSVCGEVCERIVAGVYDRFGAGEGRLGWFGLICRDVVRRAVTAGLADSYALVSSFVASDRLSVIGWPAHLLVAEHRWLTECGTLSGTLRDERSDRLSRIWDRIYLEDTPPDDLNSGLLSTLRDARDRSLVADASRHTWPVYDWPLVQQIERDHRIHPTALLCAVIWDNVADLRARAHTIEQQGITT